MTFCKFIIFLFFFLSLSHIYIKRERERGNYCTYKLVNSPISSHDSFSWWESLFLLGQISLGIKFFFLSTGFVGSPLGFWPNLSSIVVHLTTRKNTFNIGYFEHSTSVFESILKVLTLKV